MRAQCGDELRVLAEQLLERGDGQAVEDRDRVLNQQLDRECMSLRGRLDALAEVVMASDAGSIPEDDSVEEDELVETTDQLVQRLIVELETALFSFGETLGGRGAEKTGTPNSDEFQVSPALEARIHGQGLVPLCPIDPFTE